MTGAPAPRAGRRAARVVPAAALVVLLGACGGGPGGAATGPGTSGAAGATAALGDTVAASDPGPGSRGNGSVATSYEGVLLGRRTAVAVWATSPGAAPDVRARALAAWAAASPAPLLTSPVVLGEAALEPEAPVAVALLPPGPAAADAAERLRALPGAGEVLVTDVVVHDLEVRVEPVGSTPEAVLAEVAAEGILADQLGVHTAGTDGASAVFGYTGPVLADGEVAAVLAAVEERAGAPARVVGRGDDPGLRAPAAGASVSVARAGEAHGH